MAQQITTAISDFVLVLSILYVVSGIYNKNFTSSLGFLAQGAAASAGVIRFAMSSPGQVTTIHKQLSWLATILGVPLISLGFCSLYGETSLRHFLMVITGVVMVGSRFAQAQQQALLVQAASGLAMLCILYLCLMNWNLSGLLAGIVYVTAGLIIGSEGKWNGLLRVDLLHYALVVGNLLFLRALS